MSDESIEAVRSLLTGPDARPVNKPEIHHLLWQRAAVEVSNPQLRSILNQLVRSRDIVAAKGVDLRWDFPGKRRDAVYYIGAARYKAHRGEIANAEDKRKRKELIDKAANLADLAMRSRHPDEWNELHIAFHKELTDKENKG